MKSGRETLEVFMFECLFNRTSSFI